MRSGRLLAEASPQNLMDFYDLPTLEKVFLKLCIEEGDLENTNDESNSTEGYSDPVTASKYKARNSSVKSHESKGSLFQDNFNEMVYVQPWVSLSNSSRRFSLARNKALIIKNMIRMKRNLGFLFFSFFLPAFQTILFCLTVGGTPHDLSVAVVNLDTPVLVSKVSEMFLNNIDSHIIKQKEYDSFDEGYSSVTEGKAWCLIFMNTTFSAGLILGDGDEDLDGVIHVYMDDTNQAISLTIKIQIYESLAETILEYVDNGPDLNRTDIELPLKFEEPVYGVEDNSFRNFVAPGVLITIIYFMAVGLTSLSFIIEKKEGLLERSWVSGVTTAEVLFSHLITEMLVMMVQIVLILVFMFPVFKIPCKGSLFWVIVLSILQGICGMTYGLMVSGFSKDEITAIQIILGTFYPILLISGIVWPVEGMPNFLRYISYVFPQTYACNGMRAIFFRGWDITYPEVYIGYIVTVFWGVLHIAASLIAIDI